MNTVSRRSFLAIVSAASAAAVLSRRAFAAEPLDPPFSMPPFATAPVDRVPLAGGMVMLSGPGGNITVLPAAPEEGGTLMVDSGIAPRADDVLAAVTAVGNGVAPRTLVDTHWHADHAGGNVRMAQAGATVVAHDNTLARVSAITRIAFFGFDVPPIDPVGRPTITFADKVTLHRGARAIHVVHVPPAHTDSDVYVHVPELDVLATGDLFTNGYYPFIDYSTGGSLDGMIAAELALLDIVTAKTKVVPGHGPLATRADLEAAHEMLVTVRDRLLKFAADKAPLAKVQEARPLADLDGKWGQRMFHGANFIHLVYPAMLKA